MKTNGTNSEGKAKYARKYNAYDVCATVNHTQVLYYEHLVKIKFHVIKIKILNLNHIVQINKQKQVSSVYIQSCFYKMTTFRCEESIQTNRHTVIIQAWHSWEIQNNHEMLALNFTISTTL